jgi:NADPH:quinone reductase-like Zn-dependent oxidoreductase
MEWDGQTQLKRTGTLILKVLQFDRYGDPDVLHVVDRTIPEIGAGDVLVRVHAATVGWGDCKLRKGLLRDFFRPDLPKVPGRYGSGIVIEVGASVSTVKAGDGVVIAPLHSDGGSAAEYVRVPCDKIAAKPGNLDHVQTASMIQGAVSAYACLVQTGRVTAEERVLIHGAAGSVGSACVELARHFGTFITATCREADHDYVRSLGAQRIIAFDRGSFVELAGNQDIVVDPVGGDVHRQSIEVLGRGGRLVYLNAAPIEGMRPPDGIQSRNVAVSNDTATLDAVCRLAEHGVFSPKVGRVLSLKEGATAHRLLEQGAVKRGRIVLKIDE